MHIQQSNIVLRNGQAQRLERWIQQARSHRMRALLVKREFDGSFTCETKGPLGRRITTWPLEEALKRAGVAPSFWVSLVTLFTGQDLNELEVEKLFPGYLVQSELPIEA